MSCGKPCNCESYLAHLRSISMQPTVHAVEMTERRWDKDMGAYKRLRKQGLQPKTIDGAAELEKRATTQQEIELGHVFSKKQLDDIRDATELAKDLYGDRILRPGEQVPDAS